MVDSPTEQQRLRAVDQAQELGQFVVHECPNAATLLLVAVYLVHTVERIMGEQTTRETFERALVIARETSKPQG